MKNQIVERGRPKLRCTSETRRHRSHAPTRRNRLPLDLDFNFEVAPLTISLVMDMDMDMNMSKNVDMTPVVEIVAEAGVEIKAEVEENMVQIRAKSNTLNSSGERKRRNLSSFHQDDQSRKLPSREAKGANTRVHDNSMEQGSEKYRPRGKPIQLMELYKDAQPTSSEDNSVADLINEFQPSVEHTADDAEEGSPKSDCSLSPVSILESLEDGNRAQTQIQYQN